MDNLSHDQRKYTMSRIRSRETRPEKAVRSSLHRHGFRFRKNVAGLPGTPDIVMKKHGTVVLINGCFWHQHAGCPRSVMPKSNRAYWKRKLQGNIERDRTTTLGLRKLGWRVITLWQCQIEHDCESLVCRRVIATLRR